MLQRLRVRAQTTSAKVIFGLIAFVLVVFGFGAFNLFATFTPPGVAVVNGYDIPEAALSRALNVEKSRLRQRYGDQYDLEEIDQMVNVQNVLDGMIEHQLYVQKAAELGIVSSRQHYLDEVFSNPFFQEDGVFKEDLFKARVPMLGYSLNSYEEELRKDQVVETLWELQRATSFYTQRELMEEARVGRQTRDFAYLLFDTNSYVRQIEPAEEEITKYYDEHVDDYMSDESFELSYIVISKADYTEGLEVSEEDIQVAIENETRLAQENAERKSQHILLKVNEGRTEEAALEQIGELRQRIVDGEKSFGEIAGEYSEDESNAVFGGDLGFAGRGYFVPEFEDVLFAMEVGEMSDPVVTQFGVHLIKLNEIQEIDVTSLDDRYEEIRQEMLEELATPDYEEALRDLADVAYDNETLEPVAEAFGKEIQTQSGVTRSLGEGVLDAYDVRDKILTPDVLDNEFNSAVVEIDGRSALVARLMSRTPPELKPLDDVRIQIQATLRRQEAARRVEQDRDAAFQQLLETEDFNQVATDFGVEWQTEDRLGRWAQDAPYTVRDKAFEISIFEGDEREILAVDGVLEDKAILVVTGMHDGQWDELPQSDQQSIRDDLETIYENRDVRTFLRALRNDARIKINLPEDLLR